MPQTASQVAVGPEVRRLAAADAESAAEVLAHAFADDPLWRWLLPDSRSRLGRVRQCFRAATPLLIANNAVIGVGAPLEGVAVWGLPDQPLPRLADLLNPSLFTVIFSPLLAAIPRAAPIFARFEAMQRRYAPEPHYYLSTVGVLPMAQGRGRGSAVIRPALAEADTRGLTVYTETMTPENVPLYEHFGFVVRETYRVPETDLTIWALYRPRLAASR